MSKKIKIIVFTFIFALITLMAGTGCASAKKNKFMKSKSFMDTGSSCDLSHLGKNKYFYSHYYQRKMGRSIKKINKR
jgi:hypothetical protein